MTDEEVRRPNAAGRRRSEERQYRAFFLVAALAFVLLVPCGVVTNLDGLARYAQMKALLFHHSLAIPVDLATGRDGKILDGILRAPNGLFYCKYGIAEPVLWLIPGSLAWIAHRVTGAPFDALAGFGISFLNPIIMVLIVWSLVVILEQLGADRRARWWSAALYLLGTTIPWLANSSFSEPMVALMLLWAVALPVLRPNVTGACLAGLLLSVCALTKSETALLPLCCVPLFLAPERRRLILPFWAASAVGPVLIAAMNFFCRGSITRFSYGSESSQFHAPFANMWHQFSAIDNSVLLFNSAVLLGIIGWVIAYRRRVTPQWRTPQWRTLALTTAVVCLVYVPFYMSWWAWNDDWSSYGTRFLAWLMPLAVLPSGVALTWLLRADAPHRPWSRAIAIGALALVAIFAPLQIANTLVVNEESAQIHLGTGRTNAWTHLRLLELKLERGVKGPETYRRSDFVTLPDDAPDTTFDFSSKRTFQYLYHWWSIYLANKVRYGRVL